MKKSLTRLLALILTLVVLLSSCAPTPPVVCDEHFDGTRDGLCDFCGEEVLPDNPDEPELPALTYTYLTSIPDYVDGTELVRGF